MTAWIRRHVRSILFLFAALAIAGLAASFSLPVALFPNVSFPRVRITLDSGDRPAEQMLVEVTIPVEQLVRSIPGVRSVRSNTSRGSADISVNFDWGQDMIAAMLQVQAAINRAIVTLPSGTTFDVRRMDPTVFPTIAYSLTSGIRSLVELRDLAYYTLAPNLATVPGVAKVDVLGGNKEEYRVSVDPGRLRAFGLNLSDVATALSAANVLVATGRLEEYDKLYLIISDTRLRTLADLRATIIHSGANGIVQLGDVATVDDSVQPQWIRVTADAHDAVLFQVYQQPDGNTVQIAAGIKEKLRELKRQIPSGVHLANWYDQSDLIISSAESTRDAVLIGIGLASLTLFLFLRNLRVTLIAAFAVPATLAATVLLLWIWGMSFNIMTLGGIAAAVGLIIDDSIVMIEHISRRLESSLGTDKAQTVFAAATEFSRPLFGSSASTIIIFAPLAFLSGVTGAFFKALSITMATGLTVSFFLAWLAVPTLSAALLRQPKEEALARFSLGFHSSYCWIMRPLLAHPWLVFIGLVPLLAAGWYAFNHVSSGFMPAMDEGGFIIDYHTPPGTSLTETDRVLRQLEAFLRTIPEVATYTRRTGLGLGDPTAEANVGDFFVRLKPYPRRPIEAIMEDVREEVDKHLPGVEIETAQLMEDLIGDLTTVPQPIEIQLYSDDQNTLMRLAPKVADAIGKVPGIVEVKNGVLLAGDALNISVDRAKASLAGVDPDSVTKDLDRYLAGDVTTNIQSGRKLIGVRVRLPERFRRSALDLSNLTLQAPNGRLFPLSRIATVKSETGQPEISRDDLRRMVAVTARISGRDLGSTAAAVKKILNSPNFLPTHVPYRLGGLYEQQQIAFRGLTVVLVSAVLLVFLLLLFLYENFRVAIAMLITTLLAVAAVYIGLWLTGTEFNITSRMGMTMIVGIVTEVAIFYYSEFQELPPSEDRYILAGLNRMRPIAMTTIAAILALLPLALGLGAGSAMQQPLAIAIISGLAVQLPLVLIVLPALLVWPRGVRITGPGAPNPA
jgi:CzcA family heavy metal efflux pump